jgi:murein DD-endopeptidase MepM/ murein hydrolase activator NlpD
VVKVTPNSYPAGNHIWVSNDQFKTGYAHLATFAVENGQYVERGQLIGYMGSTGMSSGPHLDYQIWEIQGGTWVNRNPLDFAPMVEL